MGAIAIYLHPWLNSHLRESVRVYEVRPRKDKRGVDLISDALPYGGLWDGEPNAISNAIGYAKFTAALWGRPACFTIVVINYCAAFRAS